MLVTGPTGSGKTTTLACMIDHINNNKAVHILTIEDPIDRHHDQGREFFAERRGESASVD